MTFTDYLKQKHFRRQTIFSYHKQYTKFNDWVQAKGIEPAGIEYTDLLDFIEYCHQQGFKKQYTSQILGVIRHYYNYLKYTGQVKTNPASGLHLKNILRRLPHDLLTHEQMEEIYNDYNQKGLAGRRNKIMLGLMVYQAVNTQELELLEPEHLQLRQGKIIIPGTARSNRRTLKLEAHQMIDLQEYITNTRELILAVTEKQSSRLFVSTGSSNKSYAALDKLMRNLRKRHDFFKNAKQIRQSRIAIWIKQYGLRQTQYMAGHKYVSSTERYQTNHLEDLQKEMDKYYPGHE
jgi:integrase/recombinase XerD